MQLRLLGYQQIVNNAGFKANLFFNLADIIVHFSVNCAEPTAPSSYRPILASTFGNCLETSHCRVCRRVMPYKHGRDRGGSGGNHPATLPNLGFSNLAPVGRLAVELEHLDTADEPSAVGLLLQRKSRFCHEK